MKNKERHDFKSTTSNLFSIGAYVRVSTDEQANVIEGSLDNQQHRIKSFVDIKNMQESLWGKITEVYIDDGYSAKDTNRPAYERMMRDLKSGKINAIMVTELSRLSRNIPDFCDFHKRLEMHGAKFFSIKEQFDSSTPSGKMMLYNMINLAQFEREQTSERVAINCHSRATRGLLNGGPAILGYNKELANKTTFVVNELEAKSVRTIFQLFIEHRTLGRTIDALADKNIKPKVRNPKKDRLTVAGRWTIESLSFLLKNKAYVGIREVNKGHKNLEQEKLKPWQRYGTHKASWPAIVDEVTFNTVDQILKENHRHERMRLATSATRVFAASGICICSECGRGLVGQSAHGRKQVHRYYVHSSKRGDVIQCSVKRIKADQIESVIAEHLSFILVQDSYFGRVEEHIRNLTSASPGQLKVDKERLSFEIQKLTLAIKNTFKIQSALDANSEAIHETAKELEQLSRKKRHLESEMESLKAKEIHKEDVDDAIDDLKNKLKSFNKGWVKASAAQKKSLLKDLLFSVIVSPNGLSIQYRLIHGLNKSVTPGLLPAAKEVKGTVIKLNEHRRQPLTAADVHPDFHNLGIFGSQVDRDGREYSCRTQA